MIAGNISVKILLFLFFKFFLITLELLNNDLQSLVLKLCFNFSLDQSWGELISHLFWVMRFDLLDRLLRFGQEYWRNLIYFKFIHDSLLLLRAQTLLYFVDLALNIAKPLVEINQHVVLFPLILTAVAIYIDGALPSSAWGWLWCSLLWFFVYWLFIFIT